MLKQILNTFILNILINVLIQNTLVLCKTCTYYISGVPINAYSCDYCCGFYRPTSYSEACCFYTHYTYWWSWLIGVIVFVIIFLICVICGIKHRARFIQRRNHPTIRPTNTVPYSGYPAVYPSSNTLSYTNQPLFYTNSSQQQFQPRQNNELVSYTAKEGLPPSYEEPPPPYGFQV